MAKNIYVQTILDFFRLKPKAKKSQCTKVTGVTNNTINKYFEIFGEEFFRGKERAQ